MMKTRSDRTALLVWLLTLAPACGADDDGDTELLAAPPAGQGRQLSISTNLAPGQETTMCRAFPIPAGDDMKVVRFEHAYSEGSHHLLVLRGEIPPGIDGDTPFECEDLQIREVVYAAQVPQGELALPGDVAFGVAGGDTLILQTHYLNATPSSLQAEARVNVWSRADASIEAGTLFLYDWAIRVPANGDATARMSCAIPEDVTLVTGMSHMHRRGVGYEAVLTGGEGGDRTLFAADSWEHVSFEEYDPPIVTTPGQTIDFHCDYRNSEDRDIIEGPSAVDNEMCMFIGFYYPKLGRDVESCLVGDSGPVRDGAQSCWDAMGCAQAATSEAEAEACMLDVCEAGSRPLNAFVNCNQTLCLQECSTGGDCMGCLQARCGEELGGCMATDCE